MISLVYFSGNTLSGKFFLPKHSQNVQIISLTFKLFRKNIQFLSIKVKCFLIFTALGLISVYQVLNHQTILLCRHFQDLVSGIICAIFFVDLFIFHAMPCYIITHMFSVYVCMHYEVIIVAVLKIRPLTEKVNVAVIIYTDSSCNLCKRNKALNNGYLA
jgi:hypothetical protein